ncbi:MAG: squalene--hopene cyclase, partial [Candidatus Hinthialibacter sp.]
QYAGAKPDLSETVKAYLALKLMGDDPDAPHMAQARKLILGIGGAEHINTYSKFYLAALGQMPWDSVPSVPPEMILSPRWMFFHINKVSAWTRTMIMPLSIVSHERPVRRLPQHLHIKELYANPEFFEKPLVNEYDSKWFTWKNFFLISDRLVKLWERTKLLPLRKLALKRIERWILEHANPQLTDGVGAIFPPMVYNQIAFRCLGYDPNSPFLQETRRQLDRLMIEEDDAIRLQPCFSPIWDTGIALYSLTEAGLNASHSSINKACEWLIHKECRHLGDWKANIRRPVEPAGWYFEFNNSFYPDVDDTAMVAMALHQAGNGEAMPSIRRAIDWILAMQNKDGGWAAFDRTQHRPILEAIPFADHNAMQDPSCPDITGRVLESLGHHGYRPYHEPIQKALRYLKSHQKPDGCWFGRWGVNYIYGTWEVLCGLKNAGVDMHESWVQKAGQWLKSIQKPDGSFGESADSYEFHAYAEGPSTASQTAWAAMGMMAIYGSNDPAAAKAIQWLVDTQNDAGKWDEPYHTGSGFPRVFYLRYHLYSLYFPIMALGRYLRGLN